MGRAVRTALQRNRDRANLSFLLAVTFFVVFSVIVLSEVFFIEEKNRTGPRSQFHQNYRPATSQDSPSFVQSNEVLYPDDGDKFIALLQYSGQLRATGGGGGGIGTSGSSSTSGAAKFGAAYPLRTHPLPTAENLTATDALWLPVAATTFKFFVYSAYLDQRGNKLIRVIAATKTRNPERVWCRLWSPSGNDSQIVNGKVKVIRENWNLKYSAVFILCSVPHNLTFGLWSVSVIHQLHAPITNLLLIRNLDVPSPAFSLGPSLNTSSNTNTLAVCVKPLHFHYNRVNQLIEFIELNLLLGASHMILYNASIGPDATCVLKQYVNEGLVTILPWKLDMISQKEIRTVGLFAALNDCLYRCMHRYSYAAFIDLDEFIIPQQQKTLPELIGWLGQKLNLRTTASYSFQNAFFYLQWSDDNTIDRKYAPIINNFVTLRKTRRKTKLNPHKQRSKYICRPEFVVEAGNHFIWEFIPGHGTLNVPSDVGLLHHYRVCEFGGNDCVKSKSVIDQIAYRYATRLVVNFHERYTSFPCALPKLPFTLTLSPGASYYNLTDISEMSRGILTNITRRVSMKMKNYLFLNKRPVRTL
ncbi:LOW QUALITY PROTEIN: beta-1,4-galactosyltransferase galt-1 [Bemisia tabaci]|uniref:LOW QUALITY PROTEIN: beta-1,4-galactosyltransferase galt-1 n=1 Tax=Bemisia tabaci TaxID=7038 RepID=UPI003B28AA8D